MFSHRGIYIAFTVAECVALVKALRVVLLKHVSKPSWDKFLVVTAFETLHVVGLCLLFFGVFPEMGKVFWKSSQTTG